MKPYIQQAALPKDNPKIDGGVYKYSPVVLPFRTLILETRASVLFWDALRIITRGWYGTVRAPPPQRTNGCLPLTNQGDDRYSQVAAETRGYLETTSRRRTVASYWERVRGLTTKLETNRKESEAACSISTFGVFG